MTPTSSLRRAAATLAVSLALAGCSEDEVQRDAADRGTQPTPGVIIEVAESEYALDATPRDGLIPADYRFVVRNGGEAAHALAIKGPGVDEQSPLLDPGDKPAGIVVRLRPGTYELWCPVGDHRARGMETTLVVEAL